MRGIPRVTWHARQRFVPGHLPALLPHFRRADFRPGPCFLTKKVKGKARGLRLPAAGAYIRRETRETFMRTSDLGWNGGDPR